MTFQDQEITLLEFPISRDCKFLNHFCAHLVKNCVENITWLFFNKCVFYIFLYSVAVELSFQSIYINIDMKKYIYIFLDITPNPRLYSMYSNTYDAWMHHMRLHGPMTQLVCALFILITSASSNMKSLRHKWKNDSLHLGSSLGLNLNFHTLSIKFDRISI